MRSLVCYTTITHVGVPFVFRTDHVDVMVYYNPGLLFHHVELSILSRMRESQVYVERCSTTTTVVLRSYCCCTDDVTCQSAVSSTLYYISSLFGSSCGTHIYPWPVVDANFSRTTHADYVRSDECKAASQCQYTAEP